MKNKKKLILKIIVSVTLLTAVLMKVDREKLITNIKLLDPKYIPLILVLLILNYVVSSFRWKSLLIFENSYKISVKHLTNLYFIGSFFNNFMPTSIGGDVFKIYKLGQKLGNHSDAFVSTFMERFTGAIALVLISGLSLIQLWKVKGLILFCAFWIATFVGYFVLKLVSKKVEKLENIYKSFLAYKGQNRVLLIAFVSSFVVQFLAIFTQYFIFLALGIKIPLFYALFVLPVVTLASFFIPSLNGIGVQDALYVQFFSDIGVIASMSLSASILYHVFRLFISLIGGVLYALGKAD